jgi:raffinose/stachyose/melibiose transport system permease protein
MRISFHLRQHGWAYVFIAPALVFYSVFVLGPLAKTVQISFYEWDGITAATAVGLDNYVRAVSDVQIIESLGHSLVFFFFYALLPIVIGLLFTGVFARTQIRGLTFFRAILFLPQILSTVVVAVAWRWIYDLDGPLNALLELVGLGDYSRAWLGDFSTALPSVGLIGTWVMYGLCMVLFIAGIQKIPREIYEAARMDGAGMFREFMTVTLPGIRGEIMFAMIFTVTVALRNFDIVWNTTSGGPGDSTKVPSIFIYQAAFITRDIGLSAAIGVLLTLLILSVTGIIIATMRERD